MKPAIVVKSVHVHQSPIVEMPFGYQIFTYELHEVWKPSVSWWNKKQHSVQPRVTLTHDQFIQWILRDFPSYIPFSHFVLCFCPFMPVDHGYYTKVSILDTDKASQSIVDLWFFPELHRFVTNASRSVRHVILDCMNDIVDGYCNNISIYHVVPYRNAMWLWLRSLTKVTHLKVFGDTCQVLSNTDGLQVDHFNEAMHSIDEIEGYDKYNDFIEYYDHCFQLNQRAIDRDAMFNAIQHVPFLLQRC